MSRNSVEDHESREDYYKRDCEVGGEIIPAGITSLPDSVKGMGMPFAEIDTAVLGSYNPASGQFSLMVHAEQPNRSRATPESYGDSK